MQNLEKKVHFVKQMLNIDPALLPRESQYGFPRLAKSIRANLVSRQIVTFGIDPNPVKVSGKLFSDVSFASVEENSTDFRMQIN